MKRNKKLNRIVEKDLSKYNDAEFLTSLKKKASDERNKRRRKTEFRASWVVCIAVAVVVTIVFSFTSAVIFNKNDSKNRFSNGLLNEVNSFLQNVKFKGTKNQTIIAYTNYNDVDKPLYNVSTDEVKIDVYSSEASLISENIYERKNTADDFDFNSFEQTFQENNDDHISISGYINTGKEILYIIYVKPIGNNDKDQFMKEENKNLVNVLHSIIDFNV